MRTFAAIAALALVLLPQYALASNTGTLRGRVTDATTGAPIAGATVVANSPSQAATTVTDAGGSYAFLSLAPETYTVNVSKTGYEPQAQAGVSIFADQTARIDVSMVKVLKTIAHTTSRSVQSLVHAGVTSDVYSVNPAGQKAAATLSGSELSSCAPTTSSARPLSRSARVSPTQTMAVSPARRAARVFARTSESVSW